MRRFASIMWLYIGLSLACSLGGLLLATVVNVPCSALIVLTMAVTYGVAHLVRFLVK